MKRFFAVILACCLIISLCAACGNKDNSGYVVSYDLTRLPGTIDPQLATSGESLMLIENTFEGLLRKNGAGELVTGAATGFTISGDALTYTFTLRTDAMWSDGKTPVTADDFAFAFRRVVDPSTSSPSVAGFLCIKNAIKVLQGTLPISELGVSAPDAHTLVVQLDTPNPFFTETVTTAAAMPCNEEFFSLQKGRYGLEPSYLMYNGPFLVKSYDPANRIKLRRNESYRSAAPALAGGVDLIFQFDDEPNEDKPDAVLKKGSEKVLERIYEGRSDAAPILYSDADALREKNNSQIFSFENKVWGLLLNCDSTAYNNEKLRRAIALALDYSELEPFIAGSLTPANAIVPPAIKLLDKPYRDEAGDNLRPPPDKALAKKLAGEAFAELGIDKLPKTSVIFPQEYSFAPMLSVFQRQLQTTLGVFINLEPLPEDELEARVNSGDYLIAVASFTADSNNPASVLGRFDSRSGYNISGYTSAAFNATLDNAMMAGDIAQAAGFYKNAEQTLMESGVYLPLAYETSCYAAGEDLRGIEFSPFSYNVFFKFAYSES